MTKSRTLRKAAAVALSLAMAFSVATVSTDASAAAKPALKSSKVTVKVKKSKSVAIKNAKLVTKVSVKVKNSKVAAAKASKKAVKVTGKKAGKTKVVVTIKYKSGKKVKTVKKNLTVTVKDEATTIDDDGQAVVEGKITIASNQALQSDGTVLKGDTLKASLSQDIGTVEQLIWYCDGAAQNLASANSVSILHKTEAAGKFYAIAVTTKGAKYKSNELTVTATKAKAAVTEFSVTDNYDAPANVVYNATDSKAVLIVKGIRKDYTGSLKIYKATDTKGATPVATITGLGTINGTSGRDYATAKAALAAGSGEIVTNTSLDAKTILAAAPAHEWTAYGVASDDATVTYYVVPNLATANANFGVITRGTEYVAVFDQAGIEGADLGGDNEIKSTAAAAPYVKAIKSIEITSLENGVAPTANLIGEDGKTLTWMTIAAGNDMNAAFASNGVYMLTSNTAADTDTAASAGSITKGKFTATATIDNTKTYGYVKVVGTAGIFGKDALTVSSPVTHLFRASGTLTLGESTTAAKDATIGLSNLEADGTIYLVNGGADLPALKTKFDNTADLSTLKSVAVTKGSGSATITGAFSGVDTVPANAANNNYLAVFVPASGSGYAKAYSGVFTLTQTLSKYELKGTTQGITTGAVMTLAGLDQFDKKIALPAIAATAMTAATANSGNGAAPTLAWDGNTTSAAGNLVLGVADTGAGKYNTGDTWTFTMGASKKFTLVCVTSSATGTSGTFNLTLS